MPHIILEATGNFVPKESIHQILLSLHHLLSDIAGADIDSCKSRFVQHQNYLIGEGGENKNFLHLIIRLLAGRTEEQLSTLGERAFSLLTTNCESLNAKVDITVLVEEMAKQHYYKD